MTNKIIDALHGTLRVSESFVISRQTTPDDIIDYFGTEKTIVSDMKTGYFHYSLKNISIGEKVFSFLIIFRETKLDTVFWGYDYEGDGWDNWSEEKELEQEKKYNNWLTQQVGERRQFQWGTAWASFDRKSGGTSLGLRYNQ